MIETFCNWFEGYFNNQIQAFSNPREYALIELEHRQISSDTFKVTQKYNYDDKPYRETIIKISEIDSTQLLLRNYKEDGDSLTLIDGCDIIMQFDDFDNSFYGKNTCKNCIVPRGIKTTYLMTESILSNNLYMVIDRGFDVDTDEQIWGSTHGNFQFNKIKSLKTEE